MSKPWMHDRPFTVRLTSRDRARLDAACTEKGVRPSTLARQAIRERVDSILRQPEEREAT